MYVCMYVCMTLYTYLKTKEEWPIRMRNILFSWIHGQDHDLCVRLER